MRRKRKRILFCLLMTILLAVCSLAVCVVELNQREQQLKPGEEDTGIMPSLSIEIIKDETWGANTGENTEEEEIVVERPWEDQVEPIAEFSGTLPRIVCWGDSLTESVDSRSAYPDILADLAGTEVVNYGVRAETTRAIAMREGAIPMYTSECVISANAIPAPLQITTKSGKGVQLLKNGAAGVNPCYIGDIAGSLSYDGMSGLYYFTRAEEGEDVYVEAGSRLTTSGMANRKKGDVLVIFTGTNDAPDTSSVYDMIDVQRAMLDYADCEDYVIVGLTSKEVIPEVETVNEILAEEYGEHFLDVRSYFLEYGLAEAGIEPTARDEADLKKGEIPSSLRQDYVHGNEYFYHILAGQIYRKMQYLGYLPLDESMSGSSMEEMKQKE